MSNKSVVKGKFLARANKRITQKGNGNKSVKIYATRNTKIRIKKV